VTTERAPKRSDSAARRLGLALAIVIGGLVALNLVATGVDRAVGGSDPSGVAGSSYGTQDTGLGGLAILMSHYGHAVSRARGSLNDALLDPASTLFVVEPQTLTDADDAALLEFVGQGGRLVIGGSDPFYLHRLRDRPPVWTADGRASYDEVDPRLGSIRSVQTAGRGSWSNAGSSVVLASSAGAALVTDARVGRGDILFLADASPLENAYLGRADNAAFALGLAGDGRSVEFVEGVHGYGESRGLGAIPTPWKVALVVLAAAALALAWSRSRRFGPPDRTARVLAPARAEYVRALAVSLERTRDPEHALATMQEWARSRIARRAHLRPDASPEEIDRAAIALGYTEPERAAIWHPPTDDAAALALGRLVSQLSQHDGRTP
jgi:hypothetical protein